VEPQVPLFRRVFCMCTLYCHDAAINVDRLIISRLMKMELFCQELRDQIDQMTSLHLSVLEKERFQQKEKKREMERLFGHTDELKQQIKV